MSSTTRILTYAAIGALVLAAIIGFSFSNENVGASGDANADGVVTLHRGNSAEPSSLDPHRSSGTWESRIIGDMFLGLYTEDGSANAVLGAARAHTVSEDGLIHTFTLRDDQVWSDGVPVTAHDFEFAFQRILDPVMAAQYASILYIIENAQEVNSGNMDKSNVGVVAIDDHTLEIRLNRPAPYLPQLLTHNTTYPVPMHVVEANPDTWSRAGTMVTNAAYVLEEWVPNDHITIVKSDTFYDADNVQIERVIFYPTDDAASALRRFRAGELDLNTDFPVQQYEWLLENMTEEVHVSPFITTSYIAVNTESPPFDDVRIRQALAMAINRNILAYRVMGTGQTPAYTLVPPLMPNYTPPQAFFADMTQEERVAAAQALMREAGYGPDNLLRFVYRYRESIDNRRMAVATAGFWEEIYVDADLVNTEVATHYDDLRAGNFELGDAGWVADYADAENYLFLVDSNSGQLNYGKYNNPEYDALLYQASQTVDLEERAAILAQAEAIFLFDLPLIPTIYGVSRNIVGQQVVGWVDNPLDIHRTRYLVLDESLRDEQSSFTDTIRGWFN